ncbi:MAG: hypothetical protein V4487_08275 [Chlamydiota bacterium]
MKILLGLLILLAGCAPSSLRDLRYEGESETHKLAVELQKIETTEDLQKALPKLKKKFNKLAGLLIKVREFSKKNPDINETFLPSISGEELFVEMARIYEIPGGRELIESAQSEAVRKF